ncbi:MAG: amino acid ABC transporter permease [Propionibacteriales bacterium]|nr:amino acid ABC transporter permease [Propionibacteriales bacterium]
MSSLLFDTPGPKARARHRIYTVISLLVLAALATVVVLKLIHEEVLTATVFNDTFQNSSVTYLLEGLVETIKAAALAIVAALVLGALLAVARLSDHAFVRWPATAFIEFFRAVPLVLLMIFLSFTFFLDSPLTAVVVALMLYNGSVLAEVFRAGINAVQKGQSEAAYALGMRKFQVMGIVLMPQAVRFMLPAIISQCVIVLKDTSLGYVILYEEVIRRGRTVAQSVNEGTILVYFTIALVFIVINYSLSKLAEYVERRLARRGVATDKPLGAANIGEVSGRGA